MVPWRCLLLAVRRRVIPSRAAPMFQVNVTRLVTLHCRNRLALGGLLLLVSSPLPPNAGAHLLPELGSDKARSQQARLLIAPVKNRTCHFDGIRLSTFDWSPWGDHEASVPISPVPQASARVQLARSLGTFVSLFSKARGLRRQSSSWCPWLSHVQTTMPHPTLRVSLGVSLGAPLPTSHSP